MCVLQPHWDILIVKGQKVGCPVLWTVFLVTDFIGMKFQLNPSGHDSWGMITLPLVQVMAQCHQAPSHNLNQSWLMIIVLYGFNRPQWVKVFKDLDKMNMCVFFCTNKQIGLMVSNAACCLTYITGATILGLYSLRRRRLISIGIPIINLRWSSDRLRFIMGIPIPVRRRLLSE